LNARRVGIFKSPHAVTSWNDGRACLALLTEINVVLANMAIMAGKDG
jgi:hypothetical protein